MATWHLHGIAVKVKRNSLWNSSVHISFPLNLGFWLLMSKPFLGEQEKKTDPARLLKFLRGFRSKIGIQATWRAVNCLE